MLRATLVCPIPSELAGWLEKIVSLDLNVLVVFSDEYPTTPRNIFLQAQF